jgi:hypothetical protein
VVKIAECKKVYSHTLTAPGIGFGETKAKALDTARRVAAAVGNDLVAAWIKKELNGAACPSACSGAVSYGVDQSGVKVVKWVELSGRANRGWLVVTTQTFTVRYHCGTVRRVVLTPFRPRISLPSDLESLVSVISVGVQSSAR